MKQPSEHYQRHLRDGNLNIPFGCRTPIVAPSSSGTLTHGATATGATVWAWTTRRTTSTCTSPPMRTVHLGADWNDYSDGGRRADDFNLPLPTGSLQAVGAPAIREPSSCTAGSFNDHDDLIFAVQ
jgi:hypothetical protein